MNPPRSDTTAGATDQRGRTAERPTDVPATGWKDIVARVRLAVKRDNVTLLSAGLAYYALLALVPGMIAGISIYGLVADPKEVEAQVLDSMRAVPEEVRDFISSQLESIAKSSNSTALLATIVSIGIALWSASAGVGKLITAINVAYNEEETRSFVVRKIMSIVFTLGSILFLGVAFTVIALLPAILADTGLGPGARYVTGAARWVILLGGMMVSLAVLYRYAPNRDNARWRWVTPGSVIAAIMWIFGSIGFSIYTANFGKYNETYGTLSAIVVVMLWLFITAMSVIIGAEVNSELERQTVRDTTAGDPQPLGSRNAYSADTVGATAEELRADKDAGVSQGGGKSPADPPPEQMPVDVRATGLAAPRASGKRSVPGAVTAMAVLVLLGAALRALRSALSRRG